jgi:hypothetical protein
LTQAWHGSFEGGVGSSTPSAGSYFGEGWLVNSGTIDWLNTGVFGSTAYEGGFYIDLNGNNPGFISTNAPTLAGRDYIVSFAFAKNPDSGTVPSAQLLLNGSGFKTVSPANINAWTDLQWSNTSAAFNAPSASTSVNFNSLSSGPAGVLLDAVDFQLISVLTNSLILTNISYLTNIFYVTNISYVTNFSYVTNTFYATNISYVTNAPVTFSNLYYQPEQSIDPLLRTSPFGEWQLEILDNRAGAGLTNTLLSWQLEFQIANTNTVSPPVFTNSFTNDFTVIESNLFVVTNSATPGKTNLILTYYLLDPPAGCTIGANTGIITWIPDESQGPSTNTITTVVYDNSAPVNYSTNSFIVIVLESNLPPFFPANAPTNYFIVYPNTFVLLNAATDSDIPVNPLTYQLSGPTGSTIDTNTGLINWPSTNGAIGSSYLFITTVTDTNRYTQINPPSFTVTNRFTVTVIVTNTAPFWPTNIPNLVFDELITNITFVTALDTDTPPNNLTYSLVNEPAGMTIATVGTNGVITWIPTEVQGPGIYTNIFVIVSDNVLPTPLTATNGPFTVTVNEVNSAPFWQTNVPSQTNYIINAFTTLVVTNTASDSDIPVNALTYTLTVTPPATKPPLTNAVIDANGIITWTPTASQAGTNIFTTVVTDTNPAALFNKSLSATNHFTVVVNFVPATNPFAFTEPATLQNGSSAQLNGMATANGAPATAWFEFGTSPAYGIRTPPVFAGTNFNVFFVTNRITGLVTNLPYHYRLVVSNVLGTTYGFDQIFDQANVVAWGATYFAQGIVPAGLTNLFIGIGAGYDTSLALNYNGTVVAWGDNTFGQTNVPAGLNNVVAVDGGDKHSLALRSDRTVRVWGSNQFQQTNVPPSLTNAVEAASGGGHCLALRDDGNIVAWGFNSSGQRIVPAGLSNVVAVSGGELHSLALKNDGTVVAWGYDGDGETDVPPGLTNVVAISAGGYHNLVLKNDGTVVAWGYNANGQTNVPSDLTNVLAIAAGGFHSMALKSDGTIRVWGDNSSLQSSPPAGISNVVAIAAGGLHSLALTSLFGLNQTNNPPFWTNGLANTTVTMTELTTLLVTNTATDTNFPPQTLSYRLLTNSLPWVSINSQGVITLSPLEPDGPSTNIITTVVTDNGYPPLSATNSFTLIVRETNSPPQFILTPTNRVVGSGVTLIITNAATDSDIPPNTLVYSLLNAPPGASVDTNSGVLTLTLNVGTNLITTIVTDNGIPPLSATNAFTVIVTNLTLPTNAFSIYSIVHTNINSTDGFLLTWFAPSNYIFQVQWTPTLAPQSWSTFTNFVGYNPAAFTSPTNTQFNFFDDGSQFPFGPTRFYRLVLQGVGSPPSGNTLILPVQTNRVVNTLTPVTVTNTATDSNPGAVLTYTLVNPPADASISTNGVIIWTNAIPAGLAARFTTIVTDDGIPAAHATNTFTVFVAPFPSITNVTIIAGNVVIQWTAPTNDVFQVQWATNLVPVVNWFTFSNTFTSTTGLFSFTDTNAPLVMKFYRLLLLP